MSVWQLAQSFSTAVATRGRRAIVEQIYASPIWRGTLGGPAPEHILYFPRNLHRRNIRVAQDMLSGQWKLPGGVVACHEISPFLAKPPSEIWSESLHGFGWIAHFDALGTDAARTKARHAVAHWLRAYSSFHPIGWRPQVTARRIMSWLSFARFVLADAEPGFRNQFLRSLARQSRHLARTAASAPDGVPRLCAAAAVTLSGLCLPGGDKRAVAGAHALSLELDRQILADGGHISRSPEQLAFAMADVLMVANAFRARDRALPPAVRRALDRMAPALRFYCHGDGRLALFNGSSEGPDGWASQLLAFDDAHGVPLAHASHVGFHRLTGGDSLVIADGGTPPPVEFSTAAHAGTLSFEFSHGPERIIVNCGSAAHRDGPWQVAMRTTAAHSTVVVADTSSAQLLSKGFARSVVGAQLLPGPKTVQSRRASDMTGQSVVFAHDGYMRVYGVRHQRSLLLSVDGFELDGEDALSAPVRPEGAAALPFLARFHVHPDVRAELSDDGLGVDLTTPAGSTWKFSATGGKIALSDSVYCGDTETIRHSKQIILSAMLPGGGRTVLHWSLKHLQE